MNKQKLKKQLSSFVKKPKQEPEKFISDYRERLDLIEYYKSFDKQKILSMTSDDLYPYISKLWAMLIWGNQKYIIDKILEIPYVERNEFCPQYRFSL